MTEIKWEEPEVTKGSRDTHRVLANALRQNPGKWALLAEDAASGLVTKVNKGTGSFAPGGFEARGTVIGKGRSKVWARYVGESA